VRYIKREQHMQFLKTSFFTFFLCAVLAVVGAGMGFFAGIGIDNLRLSSILVSWKLLDSPVKFAQIVDANTNTAWAKSTEDKLYTWECQTQKECKWIETREIPLDVHDGIGLTTNGDTCQLEGSVNQKKQPENVVGCVFTQFSVGESSQTDFYALLDDGTIWHGFYSVDGYAFVFIILISTSTGGVSGIIAGMTIMYRKEKRAQEIERQTYRPS